MIQINDKQIKELTGFPINKYLLCLHFSEMHDNHPTFYTEHYTKSQTHILVIVIKLKIDLKKES